MKKLTCSAVVLTIVLCVPAIRAQNTKPNTPNTAVVIPDAEMQGKLKEMIMSRVQDDAVRVVRAGDSHVGVFLIHLNPGQTPQEPIQLMSHNDVAEVYYVLKGEGTLYHGGTLENPTQRSLATTGGPSMGGTAKDKLTQRVGPGDVFIVPPNTPHQVNLGARTEMVYLVVRIDPKEHLQLK